MDLGVSAMGLAVGFVVGLTGMGGGALMTPLLVLLFNVQPLAAVSSDLVAAVIMKPIGGSVHLKRGTVDFRLVKWLALGSVPSAFVGVLILRSFGDGEVMQNRIKVILDLALLVAACSMVVKAALGRGRVSAERSTDLAVRRLPTLGIGVAGGLIVGMTSVGSGSLMIVLLLALYPRLKASQLVGTDLVQAVPLVLSAAIGHLLFGDFELGLTAPLLVGSVPGVYLGACVSSRANDALIRPVLWWCSPPRPSSSWVCPRAWWALCCWWPRPPPPSSGSGRLQAHRRADRSGASGAVGGPDAGADAGGPPPGARAAG